MKKALAAISIIFFCFSSPVLHAEGIKIGFVDGKKILDSSQELQLLNKHSQALIDAYNKFVNEQNALMANATPEKRQTITQAIDERKKKLDVGLGINNKKYMSYIDHIREVLKSQAAELKLDMLVLNQDFLLLTGNYVDLTETVLKKLNETQD